MVDMLVARRKDKNLTFRALKRKKDEWTPEDYGCSGKDMQFEAVIRNKDSTLISYLLWDLENLGYPIKEAIKKYKEMSDKPGLFFLR